MKLQTAIMFVLAVLTAQVGARHMRSRASVLDAATDAAMDQINFKVGMVSWNVAEVFAAAADDKALVAALDAALEKNPDLFAFAYQENLLDGAKTEVVIRAAAGTKLEDYVLGKAAIHMRSNEVFFKRGHGYSGIMVFRLKTTTNLKCSKGPKSAAVSSVHVKHSEEKGMTSIACEHEGRKLCFGSTHSDPHKYWKKNKKRDRGRVAQFAEYSLLFAKGGCQAIFWGGDFNWRNGDWKQFEGEHEKAFHSQFKILAVKTWLKKLDANGFVQSVVKSAEHTIPPVLLQGVGTPGSDSLGDAVDERTTRPAGWLEGPGTSSATQLVHPPTFQPATCPADWNDPTSMGPGSRSDPDTERDWTDKSALCLPVKSGGNCPSTDGSEVRYMCFSAQRPVCWTDAIYHKVVSVLIGGSNGVSVKSNTYGPVIMPTKSDHYPVAGTWTTSIVKEATSVVKAG